jgi:ribosomal protein L16 Arg81 hydroxylase
MVQVNYRHPPVSTACEDMEKFFGQHCQANVYVTPALQQQEPNQGFEIHWDEMESYVVQVSGSKHWCALHPHPTRLPFGCVLNNSLRVGAVPDIAN